MNEIEEMVKAYDEYISLLGEELDELALIAYAHGWKSKRAEQGIKLRTKIETLKEQIHHD